MLSVETPACYWVLVDFGVYWYQNQQKNELRVAALFALLVSYLFYWLPIWHRQSHLFVCKFLCKGCPCMLWHLFAFPFAILYHSLKCIPFWSSNSQALVIFQLLLVRAPKQESMSRKLGKHDYLVDGTGKQLCTRQLTGVQKEKTCRQ